MSISKFFQGFECGVFSPIEHVVQETFTFLKKEIEVSLPQNVVDAIARIKSAIASQAGDATTIANLQQQLADTQKHAGDLQTELNDAQAQLTELLSAILAAAPAAPPAGV